MKTDMLDLFRPSIIVSETHFPLLGGVGVMADAMERIAGEGFFRNVELPHIPDAAERRRIIEATKRSELSVTNWLTPLLVAEKLSLSTADEELRKKTIGIMLAQMALVEECGGSSFAIGSGPDPGPGARAVETEQFHRSLCELCEAASGFDAMRIIVEPMDREAHKNCLIGPTAEFVPLINRVRETYPNLGICWDAAHVSLCGDDPFESLTASRDITLQLHLSNAVLDRASPAFGDHHMPAGAPGFLTVEIVAALLRKGLVLGILGEKKPSIAIEARTPKGGDPWANVARSEAVLREAWDIMQSKEGG